MNIGILLLLLTAGAGAETAEFMGVDVCKRCHMPHYESWGETKMSKAFDLLRPGVGTEAKVAAGFDPQFNYTDEPYCQRCHTTGFGEKGGFISLSSTPEMTGVQCEVCHGPGSKYVQMMYKKKGTYKRKDFAQAGLIMPSQKENICIRRCHNENTPFFRPERIFDFADRKSIGTHRHDIRTIVVDVDIF